MMVAQQLYEGIALGKQGTVGLITYMRTDSTRIADSAKEEAAEYIEKITAVNFQHTAGVKQKIRKGRKMPMRLSDHQVYCAHQMKSSNT